jgi:hypothetical protein
MKTLMPTRVLGPALALVLMGPAPSLLAQEPGAPAPGQLRLDQAAQSPEEGGRKRWVAPYNQVVVLLDASGSFWRPARDVGLPGVVPGVEALRMLQDFAARTGAERGRRTDGIDAYSIVAVDAHPDIVWSGTRQDLAALQPDVLERILRTRAAYRQCTDVAGAFAEAIRNFQTDAARRYLIVFSDLIHEPPAQSFTDCAPAQGSPPDINWDALSGTAVGLYFVSSDFRYQADRRWRDALERHGFAVGDAGVLSLPQALSRGVHLAPPSRAVHTYTAAEREEGRARLAEAKGFLKHVVLVAFVLCVGGYLLLRRALSPAPLPPAGARPVRPVGTLPRRHRSAGSRPRVRRGSP